MSIGYDLTWSRVPVTPAACKPSLHVCRRVVFGLPLHSLPPSGVPFVARLAGLAVRRRSTCPMNLLRLTAGVLQVTTGL